MPPPLVSVLIDTYNHERFIDEAVASVLAQDYPVENREILVVDDGSTDATPEILRKFEPHIRILRKSNGGQASAFNYGIPQCRGEIVAFLDGDDCWAPTKLSAVVDAFRANSPVGLVGHGIVEVFADGREVSQVLLEGSRFRIDSEAGARLFRVRKSFLGTSRMALRSVVLQKIGPVPESLRIQADEYLFTLGAVFSEALILREPLTFYRLHDSNAFQISANNPAASARKQQALASLAESLRYKLAEWQIPADVIRAVVDAVQAESDHLRLSCQGGFPWETVSNEIRNYRVQYPHASLAHWFFKSVSLLPAFFLPPRVFYSLRQKLAAGRLYRKAREKWLPFLKHEHLDSRPSQRT